MRGGAGNDTLLGGGILEGGAGEDHITATTDGSVVDGGDGNDTLRVSAVGTYKGGAGDDVITTDVAGAIWGNTYEGGAGNDTITGSYARDTYLFNIGDGWDTITDDVGVSPAAASYFLANQNAADYQDRVQFGELIDAAQVWFERSGNDLNVSLIGRSEGMTITGWYNSPLREIEEFRLNDGRMLKNEDVDQLVQAMAAFSPPPPGQTTLTPTQQSALASVIAASWN